ncbi:GGDEF domain-containing protein [Butyrivibrio sp. VCB2006]|uniref:GGDEF domain-containing protein n=1 Tax=Butyrivibrio sp. VCB2006 TaxID=1280679 RepID=UPI00041D530E|nr:diguanylate cyclase [Butyrivibrio sp. VCB2006]
MKKAYLRWFVPIIALYLVVGITCLFFRGSIQREVSQNEVHNISHIAEESLRSVDMIIKTVVDYNDSTAVSFANMDFYKDRTKIVNVLKALSQNESVYGSVVCTLDGQGYNEKGVNIDLKDERFFEEISRDYKSGGRGMVFVPTDGCFEAGSVVVVNYLNFNGTTKGYLITDSKVADLNSRIFSKLPNLDTAVLVELGGRVYAGNFDGDNFWDNNIKQMPLDTIKLNISQKKYYESRVEDYGNLVVIPSELTSGGIVLLISDETMKQLISGRMKAYKYLVCTLFIILTIYILANLGIFLLGRFIRRMRATKESEKIKTDLITGLYNEVGFNGELNGYARYAGDRNGMLFAVTVDCDNSSERAEIAKNVADELQQTYRLSDILGRTEAGEFLIFLKGVAEEKDIRKQTDELQLFLYDLKSELHEQGKDVSIAAGRAIYPKDGASSEEILSAARGALEKSKAEGRGSISFCE